MVGCPTLLSGTCLEHMFARRPRWGQSFWLGDSFEADAVLELDGVLLSVFEAASLLGAADSEDLEVVSPLTEDVDERESVMYQPLPLKTMPTG
jgi:hypothetical protein